MFSMQKPLELSKRHNTIAFLGALSLFLATIEFLLPRPVPFFRLGLANLPFLLALPYLKPRELLVLTLLKILGQGLVNGTLGSYVFLFSMSGSFASALLMILLFKTAGKFLSIPVISFAGAFASNAVQLSFSVLFIFGTSSFIFVIPLLLIGAASGLVLGITAVAVQKHSKWFKEIENDLSGDNNSGIAVETHTTAKVRENAPRGRQDYLAAVLPPTIRFIWGMLFLIPLFFFADVYQKGLLLILAAILAHLAGKKISITYFIFFTLSISFFHILIPTGQELFSVGAFPITLDALLRGVDRGLSLSTAVFISLFAVSSQLHLPGKTGQLLSRMFMYVEGFAEVRTHLKGQKKAHHISKTFKAIDNSLLVHYTIPIESKERKKAVLNPLSWAIMALSLAAVYSTLFFSLDFF